MHMNIGSSRYVFDSCQMIKLIIIHTVRNYKGIISSLIKNLLYFCLLTSRWSLIQRVVYVTCKRTAVMRKMNEIGNFPKMIHYFDKQFF